MKYDYFIIGGGIAGSVLAYKLKGNGFRVKLFDFHNPSSSSKVAAGLINPVTGRRFSLTWKAQEVFDELYSTYQELEDLSGVQLLYKKKIVRLCNSTTEFNDWSAKAADERYLDFVLSDTNFNLDSKLVNHDNGAIVLNRGGYLNTNKTLEVIALYLQSDYVSVEEKIDYKDIKVSKETVEFGGETANNIVFCEGYLGAQNPFFNHLPFTPMKGEILELIIPDFYEDRVFIRGGFLVPFGNSRYRAGATYDGVNINEEKTEQAKENLVQRIEKYLKVDYSINDHFVGIRPAVKDRRPLIGSHHSQKNVHLFNGFGSKGSSLSPLMANYFINNLVDGVDLPSEVNLNRFDLS